MKLFYEKYIKLAHIGKGANAHVYKVRHAELGYVRAIKILNDYIENKSERTYQSFLKECKTLLAIGNGSHPNIVRIYGPDLIDNRAIVEMDYIQGVTLDSYIKKKGYLDYDEVKAFIHDIVGALAYTHHDIYKFLMNPEEDDLETDPNDGQKFLITPEKEAELVKKYGIAHNDLHSNNVMRRDYDGSFVLLDFGLAVQDGECIKSSRKSDGSPEYKAPEKFDSGDITPRSDVYSLGVLIFEALTGRPPFVLEIGTDGKASYPSLDKICKEHHTLAPPEILPLRKKAFERQIPGAVYERDYPEWLDDVVMKCLEKKPEDRYSDAKELLDEINWHISHDRQDPPPPPSSPVDDPGEPKPKNNKKKLLFTAASCVILMATVLYYILPLGKDKHDYIPVTDINFPNTEYSLNIGDSIEIVPTIYPTNASDSIIILTSSNPEIASVKGNTIIANKSGEIILTASTKNASIHSSVHVIISDIGNNLDDTETVSDDKSLDKHSQILPKDNGDYNKPKKPKKTEAQRPDSETKPIVPSKKKLTQSNSAKSVLELSYGTWYGAVKNGKRHGKGKLVFSSSHKVDQNSDIEANPGDYFEAVYENGQLVNGTLYDNSGNKKRTIIP